MEGVSITSSSIPNAIVMEVPANNSIGPCSKPYRGKTPFLLSGGIRPESAGAIRSFRHPRLAGIDLNSGFEIEPGLKDIGKLKEFLKAIQNHNS